MHLMGFKTKQYKELEKLELEAIKHPDKVVREFLKRRDAGELTEEEKKSYIAQNLSNFESRGDELNVDEMVGVVQILLGASVDNTATVFRWNLLNLAFKPDVQEKVREELRSHGVCGPDSERRLAEVLQSGRSAMPYLNAVIR